MWVLSRLGRLDEAAVRIREPHPLVETLRTWPKERIDTARPSGHDRAMWETVDPDGRRVVLSFDRWRHIVEEHGELEPYRTALLAAVSAPDQRIPGR